VSQALKEKLHIGVAQLSYLRYIVIARVIVLFRMDHYQNFVKCLQIRSVGRARLSNGFDAPIFNYSDFVLILHLNDRTLGLTLSPVCVSQLLDL
jgi:hypothetical protein